MAWEGIWEPACLDCLSVHSSIFPNFFSSLFSLFFSPSSSLSYYWLLLWPPLPILSFPSTLGAAARSPCRPSCAKHICRVTAWLLSQHRVSLGLGPPYTAYPHPGRSAGPAEACLLLCPPSLVSPFCLSMLRELLEGRTVGYPWLVVRKVWESEQSGIPQPSLCTPPPTPGPPAVYQLHPRAQAAMTVTVWSCPGQRKGPRRTVALGAWVHGPRLPTVVQSGPSPLVVQASDDRPSRTGSADRAVTAPRGRRVTSQMWAPELLSQRLRAPLMSHALDLL